MCGAQPQPQKKPGEPKKYPEKTQQRRNAPKWPESKIKRYGCTSKTKADSLLK